MTDNELALLASQRLPGFDAVRVIASELREARMTIGFLESELERVKKAVTYGATMVKEIRMITETEVRDE
jgi:hypothetical protein